MRNPSFMKKDRKSFSVLQEQEKLSSADTDWLLFYRINQIPAFLKKRSKGNVVSTSVDWDTKSQIIQIEINPFIIFVFRVLKLLFSSTID